MYHALSTELGYRLPKKDYCCGLFLNAILADKKKVLLKKDAPAIVVPRYRELSVTAILAEAATDPILMQYLPDSTMSKKLPDREFVFDIVNAIRPNFLEAK